MVKDKTTTEEFKVTLAHKRSDRLNIKDGVFIQPKLDGVRCYARLLDGKVRMFSRNHKEFNNCKHITKELEGFFKQYPGIILDGELYNHKFKDNFNEIISIVRTSKPKTSDRFKSSSYLQYHVYDMFDGHNPNADYAHRNNFLSKCLFAGLRSVKPVATEYGSNEGFIKYYKSKFLDQGYEGAMLRANEPYQQRRSHGLQKVKDFHDTEFTITGFVEGNGKFKGGLGKFLGNDLEGRSVQVPYQKLKLKDRITLWEDRNYYLGKTATFEYFERTPDGAYRFPQFKALRNYE